MGLLAGTTGSRAGQTTAFLGGAIYTLNDRQPWASALVVRDGRIAYVGSDDGARPFIGRNARVIRLHGRMMLPGFHDAHAHPMSASLRFLRCQLGGKASRPALFAAIRSCAARHPAAAWVVGYEWPSKAFAQQPLTTAQLDALVPDRPAYIADETGYAAWVNSRALAAAGIDPAHVPAGAIHGDMREAVHARIPPATEAEYRAAFRRWSTMAHHLGITSVFDAAASPAMVSAYHAADLAGELRLRVVAAQVVDPRRGPEQVNDMVARRNSVRGPLFRADGAKIFLDGEIGQHTAALLAPYADEPDSAGTLFLRSDALNALVLRLDAEGFLIHIHVMGDAAVRAGLDAFARAALSNGPQDRRHQLAHVALADPSDIPRFGTLGVLANETPGWFQPDGPDMGAMEAALGPARSELLYPAAGIRAHGGRLVMSSDWPATTPNPLDGIEIAVTRRAPGTAVPATRPKECIDLPGAIAAYTANAAWAVREESLDGTLEAGKSADLIVLDHNLFRIPKRKIHKARVLLTLLAGEPVYRDRRIHWR